MSFDAQQISVLISSGDINAQPQSNASDFTVPLARPLILHGKWEVRCESCNFANPNHPDPAPALPTSNSIFVRAPGLATPSIVGSSMVPLLYKTPPMIATDTTSRYIFSQDQAPIPINRRVEPQVVNMIHIVVTQSNGVPIPLVDAGTGLTNYTSVSLVFRQLS
jgi:hypothetical protein